MATFAFSGRTRSGENVTGERIGDTMDAVVAALRREQIQVTKIQPTQKKAAAAGAVGKLKARGVPSKNIAVFTRQFSVMIDAGLPLAQCLDILGNQEEHKYFAQVILQTRTDVEGGLSLADAMKRHPKVFDALFCNMIAAGEAGGILDTILKRLATYIEKAVKLQAQVKSAMIYPVAVITIAVVVIGVILWKVIPTFAALFAGLGAELPLPTRIVIALSDNLVRFMPFLIIAIFGGGWAFKAYYATAGGRRLIDGITLSTLMASCVPILDGLDITAKTSGNAIIEDAIMKTRKSIERGETIAAPLKETGVFPGMVVQMIGVGEATGALDTMLGKIADFYEEEVDVAVEGLLTLLEPVMIAFLGGAVGGIVIAMYMPIFDLISKLT